MPKRIIITGASSGIGRAAALRLAKDGHALAICGQSDTLIAEVGAGCRELGASQVVPCLGDVSDQAFAPLLARAADGLVGEEIVLIHSAGMAILGPMLDLPLDAALKQIHVNLCGTLIATYALLPKMLDYGSGLIINVGSVSSFTPFAETAAYCASKAGMAMFAKCIAAETRKRGIRVSSVHPGSVDTPLWNGQPFKPEEEDMLTADAVATEIARLVDLPPDRVIEEVVVMPPKGVL